jgi:hypothetical protein
MEEKIPTYIRSKGKHKADYTYSDMYKPYLNTIKDSYMPLGTKFEDSSYNINLKQHNKILKDFHKIVFKKICEDSMTYKLPCKLGAHSVVKYKDELFLDKEGNVITKYLAVDYVKTKLLWKEDEEARLNKVKVYNLNEHSNGYRYRFFWEKRSRLTPYKASGIIAYTFTLSRENKRYLSKVIKEDKTDYYFLKTKKQFSC